MRQNARTYPTSLMVRARTLHAGGWGAMAIRRLFIEEGVDPLPGPRTILRWIRPELVERDRVRSAERYRRVTGSISTFRLPGRRPAYQAAFMEALEDAGVPRSSIAKVCCVVFDGDFTRDDVRSTLGPRKVKS